MILLLMFGLPIIGLFWGDSCYNLEKVITQVTQGIERLHNVFSNTKFYENSTECEMEPFCHSSVMIFREVLKPLLYTYVSNFTLAGVSRYPNI